MIVAVTGCSSGALKGLKKKDNNTFVTRDKKYEELVDKVEYKIGSMGFEGSLILATDDDIVLYSGPAAKDINGDPVDPYTTYDIGSCTKLITATAIFQLIEQGKVSLDDPINKYFPDYEKGKDITVYNLLHMQSGIPDIINEVPDFWQGCNEDNIDEYYRKLCFDIFTDEEFLENLYQAELHYEPGTKQTYCNTNYLLLAMIIEQVSGMEYCDYLQKNIFDVCKMEHTTSMVAGDETSVPEEFEMLYEMGMCDEKGYFQGPRLERGCGGVHTCAYDLLSFDRALMQGKLISEDSFNELRNFDKGYGCGLMEYDGYVIGHSGSNSTFVTQNIIIDSPTYGRLYLTIMCSSGNLGKQNAAMAVLKTIIEAC